MIRRTGAPSCCRRSPVVPAILAILAVRASTPHISHTPIEFPSWDAALQRAYTTHQRQLLGYARAMQPPAPR